LEYHSYNVLFMILLKEQVVQILPKNKDIDVYVEVINKYAAEYGVNTLPRMQQFLAQVLHESGGLTRFEENLNYSANGLKTTFGNRYFTDQECIIYARQPKMIGNKVYANRYGNGNEASGDGWKYRGRGAIQLTFKDNYKKYGEILGIDLVETPDLLLQPEYAIKSALAFWKAQGCNQLADKNDADNFKAITKKINGGYNGLAERITWWEKCQKYITPTVY